jgi:hypothetical protein
MQNGPIAILDVSRVSCFGQRYARFISPQRVFDGGAHCRAPAFRFWIDVVIRAPTTNNIGNRLEVVIVQVNEVKK